MENPIKMDDLGGKPTIFGNIHLIAYPRSDEIQRCPQKKWALWGIRTDSVRTMIQKDV